LKLLQTWTGHCAMAQTPPSTNTQKSPSKKIEKFPKLFNCPKRICNNPNPNPAMLQFRSFFTGMRAGVQPTLDPSAETFWIGTICQPRERRGVDRCVWCACYGR